MWRVVGILDRRRQAVARRVDRNPNADGPGTDRGLAAPAAKTTASEATPPSGVAMSATLDPSVAIAVIVVDRWNCTPSRRRDLGECDGEPLRVTGCV